MTVRSRLTSRRGHRSRTLLVTRELVQHLESRRLLTGYVPLAPTTSMKWTSGFFTPSGTVNLQGTAPSAPNQATSASTTPTVQVNANGLPLLESRPNGAGLELFLDFAFDNGYYHPYSTDGDRANYNASEQRDIFNAWRGVASYFSMLNVNVTTVLPTNNENFAWIAITNEFVWGGEGAQPGIGQTRQAFVDSTFVSDYNNLPGVFHELGHNLGMWHQADYDYTGTKTHEYTNGIDGRNRFAMGSAWYGTQKYRTNWGRSSEGAWAMDNEISDALYQISSNVGGDGFRPDDFGNDRAGALNLGNGSGGIQKDAYLERPGDNDYFKLTPTTSGRWAFAATPMYFSTARPVITLEDANGNTIATDDDAGLGGATFEASFTANLQANQTYYTRVTWDGDYASLGYYNLSVSPLPANFNTVTLGDPIQAGNANWDPATNTFTQISGGADIWNAWDQGQYSYATLTGDGVITARIDGIDNIGQWTKAGIDIRQSTAANAAHVYFGKNPNGNLEKIARGSAGANAFNPTPAVGVSADAWVRIERAGNVFTYWHSADGVTWTSAGSVTVAMTGPVTIGVVSTAWSDTTLAAATISNVSVSGVRGGTLGDAAPGDNALPAPTNVNAIPATGNTTDTVVSWTAAAGAQGYGIERSNNGVDWYWIANVDAATTTYRDAGTTYAKRWFYRVHALAATNPWSVPSAAASVLNKPAAPGMTWGYTSPDVIWSDSEIFINWIDTHGETGYRVERSTDGVAYTFDQSLGQNATGANIAGLLPGRLYWFRVTPTSPQGDGVPTVITSQTRLGSRTASNFRVASRSSTSVSLAWANDVNVEDGYRIERSTDGTNWTFLANAAKDATTYIDSGLTPGAEYYYRLTPYNQFSSGGWAQTRTSTPPSSLPAGWSEADVGSVTAAGAATSSDGTSWSLISAGGDLAGAADSFHYAYRGLTNDTSIVARVNTIETTNNAAKAGLVIRQSLDAGSMMAALMLNAGGGWGIDWRTRATVGGNASYQQVLPNAAAPYWLKLTKAGATIIASYSADGAAWTQAATVNLSLAGTFYVGLANTAADAWQLNTSSFGFVGVGNNPPTIATAAAASNTTKNSTALSVLGADGDQPESTLTYTWSVAAGAPGSVTFSQNGTNAAKNTTATFTKAGTYTLLANIQDASGLTVVSSTTVVIGQVLSGILPAASTIAAGTSVAMTGADQFGDPMPLGTGLSFSSGVGSITQGGVFTAPASGSTAATISAAAGSATYTTTVTITAGRAWYQADASGATLLDSSGSNNTGTLSGAYSFSTGKSGLALGLTGGYAALPTGIVNGLNDFTIAAWVNLSSNTQWSRLFDFGTGTDSYMFLTANAGSGLRFAITTSGGGGEQVINGPAIATGTWTHVAVSLVGNVGTLYVNGVAVGTNTNMTLRPSSLGATTNNYLGKSQYADPALSGKLDDIRILGVGMNAAGIAGLRDLWQAPTVATAASATPNPVVGTSTSLSTLGASASGEAGLTYTWSAIGASANAVTFNTNGTNAAKNAVATFASSGTYQLQVTIANALGASVTSAVTVQVTVPSTKATVTSATESWGVSSHTMQFTLDRDVGPGQDWSGIVEIASSDHTRTVAPSSVLYDASSRTLTVGLPLGSAMADGDYTVTLKQGTLIAADYSAATFALAGDANRDRVVNFADLLILARNYGTTGHTLAEGDSNGDGAVDFQDLLALAKNYGKQLPALAAASEPASALSASTRTRAVDTQIVN